MEQDVIDHAHAEVQRIVAESLQWNARGFTEMPAMTLCEHKSVFDPIDFKDLLIRETLTGIGFVLRFRMFRGKKTLFVNWDKDYHDGRGFFERAPIIHWSKKPA